MQLTNCPQYLYVFYICYANLRQVHFKWHRVTPNVTITTEYCIKYEGCLTNIVILSYVIKLNVKLFIIYLLYMFIRGNKRPALFYTFVFFVCSFFFYSVIFKLLFCTKYNAILNSHFNLFFYFFVLINWNKMMMLWRKLIEE